MERRVDKIRKILPVIVLAVRYGFLSLLGRSMNLTPQHPKPEDNALTGFRRGSILLKALFDCVLSARVLHKQFNKAPKEAERAFMRV